MDRAKIGRIIAIEEKFPVDNFAENPKKVC